MSVKSTRMCDNPSCGRIIEKYWNAHYFHVDEIKPVMTEPGDNGPWDFCSAECLETWAGTR